MTALTTLVDHLCDIGSVTAVDVQRLYGIGNSTFRGVIKQLRAVLRIHSREVKINGKKYQEHSLIRAQPKRGLYRPWIDDMYEV